MKPSNMHHASHRVTHTRMITQRRVRAIGTKAQIQNHFIKPWGRNILPAVENPAGKRSKETYLAAAGLGGLALLGTACNESDILGEHTNNQTYMMVEEKSHEKIIDSVNPLPVLAVISAVAFVWFTIDGLRSRRKVPGIIGPSGLVPSEYRKDESNNNPFPELVTTNEFARIKAERGIWGKKKRKEKYCLHMEMNNFEVSLVPNDFKFTFNKNAVPALVSLGAAMLFFALWANGVADAKETLSAPTQQAETRSSE